jgi:hypothetical protein
LRPNNALHLAARAWRPSLPVSLALDGSKLPYGKYAFVIFVHTVLKIIKFYE